MPKQKDAPPTMQGIALQVLKSGLYGLAVTMLLVLLAALLLATGFFKSALIPVIAVAACVAGGLLAGWRTVRKVDGYALWFGALSGLVLFLLLYILGAILFTRLRPAANSLPIFLSVLSGAVGGSLLHTLKRNQPHKKR